mmetsp:Transcript_5701/g.16058  ORF Transcript_5701/g.16058 Transcript_5701/m.16058 type:complete len:811 (-) Transcript_5701:644-3076(-)
MPRPTQLRRNLSSVSSSPSPNNNNGNPLIAGTPLFLFQNTVVVAILSALCVALLCWNSLHLLHQQQEQQLSLLGTTDAWYEEPVTTTTMEQDTPEQMARQGKNFPPFTVVILTMNRLLSLQRLLKSLEDSHYGNDTVNLDIRIDQLPPSIIDNNESASSSNQSLEAWNDVVAFAQNYTASWSVGSVNIHIAPQHLGLRQSWLQAWRPPIGDDNNNTERAIILEDDVEVSALWYQWVQTMYHHYGNDASIAGFSLQRQQLIPIKERIMVKVERALSSATASINNNNNNQTTMMLPRVNSDPFLYRLVGSIGFVPMARVWRDFLEWMQCASCQTHGNSPIAEHEINNNISNTRAESQNEVLRASLVDVTIPGLVTSDWHNRLNQQDVWTQHMIYFMNQQRLYCLYQFPLDGKALATHHNEPGAHLHRGRALGADFSLATHIQDLNSSSWNALDRSLPASLLRFDLGMRQIAENSKHTLVVAWTAGYNVSLSEFELFVHSLRRHYDGDAKLVIDRQTSNEIRKFLNQQGIHVLDYYDDTSSPTTNATPHQPLGFRLRLNFYTRACQSHDYDWCLMIQFPTTYFQAHPFRWSPLLRPKRSIPKPEMMALQANTSIAANATNTTLSSHSIRAIIDYDLLLLQVDEKFWDDDALLLHDEECVSAVWDLLVDKPVVQASGFYATPSTLMAIQDLALHHPLLSQCDSEFSAFNIAVHAGLLSSDLTTSANVSAPPTDSEILLTNHSLRIKIYNESHLGRIIHEERTHDPQRLYTRDNLGRLGGSDCRVSPMVISPPTSIRDQLDREKQQQPLNAECLG